MTCLRRANHAGFTLAEMLVTIVLLVLVMVLLVYPMFTGFAYVEQGVARADAQSSGRAAMDAMTRELAEAIYVYDIPPDGSTIAFTLPSAGEKRAAPPSPQLTEPAPGTEVPVRYWRVLTRLVPQVPWQASEVVARVEVVPQEGFPPAPASPLDTSWPDSAYTANYNLNDTDLAHRRDTSGALPPNQKPMDPRYSGRMTSLTPNALGFEVPDLSFWPQPSEGETLQPALVQGEKDYSVYRARWGAWQQFLPRRDPGDKEYDPLTDSGRILVYRRSGPDQQYLLKYHTRQERVWNETDQSFEIHTMIVEHPSTNPADHSNDLVMYDVRNHPLRDPAAKRLEVKRLWGLDLESDYAFGIDMASGQLLFSFPQPDFPSEALSLSVPLQESEAVATLRAKDPDGPGGWNADPLARIVPGSDTVWSADGQIFQRVAGTQPLKRGQYSIDYEDCTVRTLASYAGAGLRITYRWRNNKDDDLVRATYYTKSIITISLTTAKRFHLGRQRDRLEPYHTQAQVKVRNLLR
jgi:type II secretory pathway pseudopilin PulG